MLSSRIRQAIPFALLQLLSVISAQSETSVPGVTLPPPMVLSTATSVIIATIPPIPSTTSTPTDPKVHVVKVGAGGFKFEPESLEGVLIGDVVTFEFYPPDHSVARADFNSPCMPYEYSGSNRTGFFSGVQMVDTYSDLTHYNVTINSTEPIFYYCTAPGSCLDHEMVGVINPNATQTLDKQIIAVKDATIMVAPGEPVPKEGEATSTTLNGPTGSPNSAATASNSHTLSRNTIIGIAVGAVVFVVICAALFYFVGRARSLKEGMKRRDATVSNTTEQQYTGIPGSIPNSPAYTPYSPNLSQAEYGSPVPPGYGEHNQHMWGSPTLHPSQMAMVPGERRSMLKSPHVAQAAPAEMGGGSPTERRFTAELEAPNIPTSPPPK